MEKKEKIAIIGGAGFVGSRLSMRFDRNNIDYEIFDKNNKQNFKFIEVSDIETLDVLSGFDTIINLAAEHRDDVQPVSKYDEVNVQGAKNICKVAEKYNIKKIIFTSSVAIYGFAPPETIETGDPNYFNDYGRTKYLAEQAYKQWQSRDQLNRKLVIVRPTVIFGEGNRGNVFNLLNQIASRKFIMFGDGRNKKSMAYVENVVAFLEHTLSLSNGLHIYNYIDKPDFDMNHLVSLVRNTLFKKNNVGIRLPAFIGIGIGYLADFVSALIRKPLPVSSIRVKKFIGTTQFNSSIEETGFVAPIELSDGLSRTLKYEFIEDNSDKPIFETE